MLQKYNFRIAKALHKLRNGAQLSAEMVFSSRDLKKAKKSRDKALQEILKFENRYNFKFLLEWAQKANFASWLTTHDM